MGSNELDVAMHATLAFRPSRLRLGLNSRDGDLT